MKYITSSELGDWDQCKRKWMLGHYFGLAPEEPNKGPAYVGNIVHDALDEYYRGEPHELVMAGVQQRLDAAVEDQDVPEAKAVESALAMLEGYFEWLVTDGADQDWEVLGSEEILMTPITEDATALAKLDLRMRSRETGFTGLVDHKTTGDLLELEAGAFFRGQFRHYLYVAGTQLGERIDGLVVNGIKRSKRTARATPPFYTRFTIRHTRASLVTYAEQLRSKTLEILKATARLDDGMSHHTVAPPSPRPECNRTCQFARVCPLFDDGTAEDVSILDYGFTQSDPLQRYSGLLP